MEVTRMHNLLRPSYRSMDLSDLESISKALERSLDIWGLLLLVATAVVVVGLIIEYWHDVKEFWVICRWPMVSFPWDKFKALAGGILVTLGVALELSFTYMASRDETKLRANNHRIEVFLTQQAGDAKKSAQDAEAAFQRVKEEADQVAIVAGRAQREASGAETTANAAGKKAQSVEKQASDLSNKLEAIEKASFPRHINQEKLAGVLKKYPRMSVRIETISDFEAMRTAGLLKTALEMGTWKVIDPIEVRLDNSVVLDFFWSGISVTVQMGDSGSGTERWQKNNDLWHAEGALKDELNAQGVIARFGLPPPASLPPDTLLVRVGLKAVPNEPVGNLYIETPRP